MKKIKLSYVILFLLAIMFSCNKEKKLTKKKEDIVTKTNDKISSVAIEDSRYNDRIGFSNILL